MTDEWGGEAVFLFPFDVVLSIELKGVVVVVEVGDTTASSIDAL